MPREVYNYYNAGGIRAESFRLSTSLQVLTSQPYSIASGTDCLRIHFDPLGFSGRKNMVYSLPGKDLSKKLSWMREGIGGLTTFIQNLAGREGGWSNDRRGLDEYEYVEAKTWPTLAELLLNHHVGFAVATFPGDTRTPAEIIQQARDNAPVDPTREIIREHEDRDNEKVILIARREDLIASLVRLQQLENAATQRNMRKYMEEE